MEAPIEKQEKKEEKKEQKKEKEEAKKEIPKKEARLEALTRIVATDVPSRLSVYAGLTKIKGISWALSGAICKHLNIDKARKVSTLSDAEIDKITVFIKNLSTAALPAWLLNRRKDIESGKDKHLITTELDLQREFDIRKMKRIKCYKGIRHLLGQPVRGQRTRAHFRKGRSIGVTRAKMTPGTPAKVEEKK
ncbi:MAG: 30S ribosomal protein S13 [Candidatus Pacearchaeota archaeon]